MALSITSLVLIPMLLEETSGHGPESELEPLDAEHAPDKSERGVEYAARHF